MEKVINIISFAQHEKHWIDRNGRIDIAQWWVVWPMASRYEYSVWGIYLSSQFNYKITYLQLKACELS